MKYKILIIEDEKKVAQAYSDYFKRREYQVEVAYNGEEGLNKVKEFHPDLILLDIIMPKMDGLTMLKKLREQGTKTPVIILTNLVDMSQISDAIELGSYNYLIKSDWSLADLEKRIEDVLHIAERRGN